MPAPAGPVMPIFMDLPELLKIFLMISLASFSLFSIIEMARAIALRFPFLISATISIERSRKESTIKLIVIPIKQKIPRCRISNKAFKTENLLEKHMSQKAQTKRIRILVSKLGLDGHDRGALVLCRAFRDAGMDVIYSGLFATPERIAQIVEDEDIDVVALSLLNGAHLTLFPRVAKAIKDKGINDVLVIGGGVIPEDDKPALEKSGVLGNFGPGTPLPAIIDFIQTNLSKIKK